MTNMERLRAPGRCSLAIAITLALAVVALPAPAGAAAGDLFNNTNAYGVLNAPTRATTFTLTSSAHITELVTYHWNNGQGATPGIIGLRAPSGQTYGPYKAHGTSGQNNAPNVNWVADVNVTVPAGPYVVLDSNPATWSQNVASGAQGFTIVRGTYQPASPPPGPTGPTCSGPTRVLYTNSNIGGVGNGSSGRPGFTLKSPVCMTDVTTYHWNNGQGATPGIITLQLQVGGGRTQNLRAFPNS